MDRYFSLLILLPALAANTAASPDYHWYLDEPHGQARRLSQLTPSEIRKFTESPLVDVSPVVLPTAENIVGINDYYDWPIATVVEDTIIVVYSRRPHHFRNRVDTDIHSDEFSGIRMMVRSTDDGQTWSAPVDLMQFGSWDKSDSPFAGWNTGLGVHRGVVYAAFPHGVLSSTDRGETWSLVAQQPDFGEVPRHDNRVAMRITFDATRGLVLWCTDAKRPRPGTDVPEYGGVIRAVYSPDFGQTWFHEEQTIPEEFFFSEMTPVAWNGKLAFFNRNPANASPGPYVQCVSPSGWFPFDIRSSGISHGSQADTPDLIFNPRTERFEAAVSIRKGRNPDGPWGHAKVNLYSITPDDLFAHQTNWRFDGTWIRYRGPWGKQGDDEDYVDGLNPVGGVVLNGRHHVFVWGGDGVDQSGIFQYTRSLDTDAVGQYLRTFYSTVPSKP